MYNNCPGNQAPLLSSDFAKGFHGNKLTLIGKICASAQWVIYPGLSRTSLLALSILENEIQPLHLLSYTVSWLILSSLLLSSSPLFFSISYLIWKPRHLLTMPHHSLTRAEVAKNNNDDSLCRSGKSHIELSYLSIS